MCYIWVSASVCVCVRSLNLINWLDNNGIKRTIIIIKCMTCSGDNHYGTAETHNIRMLYTHTWSIAVAARMRVFICIIVMILPTDIYIYITINLLTDVRSRLIRIKLSKNTQPATRNILSVRMPFDSVDSTGQIKLAVCPLFVFNFWLGLFQTLHPYNSGYSVLIIDHSEISRKTMSWIRRTISFSFSQRRQCCFHHIVVSLSLPLACSADDNINLMNLMSVLFILYDTSIFSVSTNHIAFDAIKISFSTTRSGLIWRENEHRRPFSSQRCICLPNCMQQTEHLISLLKMW